MIYSVFYLFTWVSAYGVPDVFQSESWQAVAALRIAEEARAEAEAAKKAAEEAMNEALDHCDTSEEQECLIEVGHCWHFRVFKNIF